MRENSQEDALTGVIGGFESRDGVSREDTEPENHIRDTDDNEGGSRAVSRASTHDEWKARSARENLDILGWARTRTFGPRELADLSAPSAEDVLDLKADPVARWISDLLWRSPGWGETAERFFGLRGKRRSEDELRSMGWPTSPQEMQEHLERLAPILEGKIPCLRPYPPRRGRVMHLEYWEKEATGQRVWVFVPVHEEGPTEEEIEEIVWREVVYVEGIRERIVLFPDD
jgi:hypothetical protein